jgi:hypothetical protein
MMPLSSAGRGSVGAWRKPFKALARSLEDLSRISSQLRSPRPAAPGDRAMSNGMLEMQHIPG